jgi:hypothetical protein
MKKTNYKTISAALSRVLYILIVFAFCSGTFIFSQPSQVWIKTFHNQSGTGNDFCEKSVIDADGNSYLACRTRTASTSDDILLLKYNSAGTLLWSKTYNYSYNGIEQPNDICLDNQGNIYVTGTSTRGVGGYYDAVLLKFDMNGNILWVKRIGKTNFSDRTSEGVSVIAGSYIYTGVSFDYNGSSECGIVKFAANGDSLAYHSLGIAANSSYRMVKMTTDNSLNYYVICTGNILPNEDEDFMIKKINTNGNITQVWSKTFTGTSHLGDRGNDIALGPDGNVFVTGYTEVNNQSYNVLLLKLGRDDGAVLMQKTYNDAISNYMETGYKISFDQNSNIIVGAYASVLGGNSDILLLKYSPTGTSLWIKKYDHPGDRNESVSDMKTDNAGNIYVISNTFSQQAQTTGLLTAKFSAAGDLEWYIEKEGLSTYNGVSSLNMDTDGSLLVSGYIQEDGVNKTVLIKYGSTIGIAPVSNTIPEKFTLSQNYPNPFNPSTAIKMQIPQEGFVKLKVFDVTGKEAAVLVNEKLNAGEYKIDFNASGLTSGVYFYRLETADFTDVKKMILVK